MGHHPSWWERRLGSWSEVRHPRNAPGPFFCNDDLCVSCGAPLQVAPDLIGVDEESGQCYFKRQPHTPAETELACRAVEASCCRGLGYDGRDPAVLARLERELAARLRFKAELARFIGLFPGTPRWWRRWWTRRQR